MKQLIMAKGKTPRAEATPSPRDATVSELQATAGPPARNSATGCKEDKKRKVTFPLPEHLRGQDGGNC